MSPAPTDVVDAVELARRAAELERELELRDLPRLQEAGALQGTRAHARLRFAEFERAPTVEAQVTGTVVMTCQRCLRPVDCPVDEQASIAVVASERVEVPGGYEPMICDPERLPVPDLVEEQVLLALPLVPMHEDPQQCGKSAGGKVDRQVERPAEDRQRPFANLRDLLDKQGQ
jgi:uncharacterized protein